VLLCATEHYGAVLNRPFDFEAYLREHAANRHTLTRLFLLFRELQTANNPYSTCKPESPDYITPWPRTGPGLAMDGESKYDLSLWNDEFFDRLHRFIGLASELGIVVEVTLFSNQYEDRCWALCPLRAENNLQGTGEQTFPYFFVPEEELWAEQVRFTRKIVTELNAYDNIYFEVCNEPGTDDPAADGSRLTDPEQVDEWQAKIAAVIRETEASLPHRHMVLGAESSYYVPFPPGFDGSGYLFGAQPPEPFMAYRQFDNSFRQATFDAVNVHGGNNTRLAGEVYHLGRFMSGQLCLADLKAFSLAAAKFAKPCIQDEDNVASCYRNTNGWTVHRKRAWTTALCGGHYDVIDFSITIYTPTGTEASRAGIRAWIGHLSKFIHTIDLPRARPLGDWLVEKPAGVFECTLAVEGEDYAVYLADPRESDEPGAGSLLGGAIRFDLPPGSYRLSTYSPASGESSPALALQGGAEITVELPQFTHDIVVRIQGAG
jgi:hypothetical protein